MKIEGNYVKIKFKDVKVGECFKFDCDVGIKTGDGQEDNAVCLNDGKMWYLGKNVEVTPVNAKVVIE
jgi:hypothetical protein